MGFIKGAPARIPFALVGTDGFTPITGATPTISLSKDGGAYAGAGNAASELTLGGYYVDLTALELRSKFNR